MPLFHVHGLVASTLSTLLSGGTVVVPNKFNPLSFWRTVRDTGATWYSAVPTIHNLLLARAGDERPAGAEGLALHPFLQRRAAARNDGANGAGLRRSRARSLRDDRSLAPDGVESPAAAERKPGSVGPGTGVEIGIMDEAGNLLPTGERGEVVIQGPNVVSRATRIIPRPTPNPLPTAGSAPAIRAFSMPTDISRSPAVSRK